MNGTDYIIVTTPRSGSGLLCAYLQGTGIAGIPNEYLQAGFLPKEAKENLAEYVKSLRREYQTFNGLFGFKIFAHDAQKIPGLLDNWFEFFPDARYIYLTRKNILAQAVSLTIALQTGRWRYTDTNKNEPQYDCEAISNALNRIVSENIFWQSFLKKNLIKQLNLIYEEFIKKQELSIRNILHFLGAHDECSISRPTDFQKIGTNINDEWIDQFLGENR